MSAAAAPLEIAGHVVAPGTRAHLDLHVAGDVTGGDVVLPIEVVHGRKPGPRLFVCAAIHGDEINGVEIIRRLLRRPMLQRLRGTLIAVPVVNVYGFVAQSRYLPDRRDLNRSFPGSAKGSLAARLAHTFLTEIVKRSTHGIDLHTGTVHRTNLPQVRACLDDEETARLAREFRTPLILNADLRDGSLRQAVKELGVPILLYEAGEALRFDETAIRAGTRGITSVMAALGMVKTRRLGPPKREPFIAQSSTWVRAPESGIVRSLVRLGSFVDVGDRLAVIADPLGKHEVVAHATKKGIVIGKVEMPLVHEGDALFHIASVERPRSAATSIEEFQAELENAVDSSTEPQTTPS